MDGRDTMSPSVASTAACTSLAAKRKRSRVSYVADDYFESLDFNFDNGGVVHAVDSDTELDDEDDDSFGLGKNSPKDDAPAKKKAKLAAKDKAKKNNFFAFMDLPPEVRNMIYDIALIDAAGALSLVSKLKAKRRTVTRGLISVEDNRNYHGHRRNSRPWWGSYANSKVSLVGTQRRELIPNLLAVSKQIHQEATDLLYSQKIFVEDTTALLAFLGAIGPANRLRLSHLTIAGWGLGRGTHKANNFAALSMLSTCTNLESLLFDCNLHYYRCDQKFVASQFYRDGHNFIEAFGTAKGKKDAVLDILELRDWEKTIDGKPAADETELDAGKKDEFAVELRKLLGK